MDLPAAEPEYVDDALLQLLGRYPWLAAAELLALAGDSPDQVRRALAYLVANGRIVRRLARVAPWSRAFLYALARPDGRLPAPQRLARLEHTRLLHELLVRLTPEGAPPTLRAALSGEAGGPPIAAAGPPVRRLADAWLCAPDAGSGRWSGLLVRWDAGERTERAERAWLAQLAELRWSAPMVAVVCASPAALEAWWPRLARRDGPGSLRLALAADLAAGRYGLGVWRDERGGAAGLRLAEWPFFKPLLAQSGAPADDGDPAVVEAGVRASAAQAARRLALSSAALAALRGIAAQPLLVRPHLARLLGTDERQARRLVAQLRAGGLVRDEADGVYATQAGVGLLAGAAGLPTAVYRRLTATAGGRLPRPGSRRGTRALGLLAHHRRHTQGVTVVRLAFQAAVDTWSGHPEARLTKWEGPACQPVFFATDDPDLVAWRRGWAGRAGGDVPDELGKVEPDAVAWLTVGERPHERTLKLLVELDYATEGPRRLARKLRHYAGWAANRRDDQALLFVVPTERRELLVQRVTTAVEAHYPEDVPLLTTTFDLLAGHGALGAIWWNGRARHRCSLLGLDRSVR
jgi:hypothetical protein